MLQLDTVYNDITSIKVLVKNTSSVKDINRKLIKQIQLKEIVPHYKNNNDIENKDDYTTFLNPSFFPESFIKFEYTSTSQDIEELFIYHDLEPWRNQLVVLSISDDLSSNQENDCILDNVYYKHISIKDINDINQYYTICQNIYEILKNYIRSVSYMKLKSPNNFMIKEAHRIDYLANSKQNENSNTYYQLTKAKYKINNMDAGIQLQSRKLKYIANILMLSGQYKKALDVLDECVVDFYKNGDFLWLANALEMVVFCLLNIISITNDKNGDIFIPHCIDYLIMYDKHILLKSKVMKSLLKHENTNASENRDSVDIDQRRHELLEKGHKNTLNIQGVMFLVVQIYEKLIHYMEYTYDEPDNYATPSILNSICMNYLWFMHQSIVCNDMNEFITSITNIKTGSLITHYLQPIKEDFLFLYKKYEMYGIFKSLNLSDCLKFINLNLNMIELLQSEKSLIFKYFYFIEKFKDDDGFVSNDVLMKDLFGKLADLVIRKFKDNKIILKRLIVLAMKYCSDDRLKTHLANLSMKYLFLFKKEEQQLIIANLKSWTNERNTCFLKSYRILERFETHTDIPKMENLNVLEQTDVVDEVYNPFRNKSKIKDEIVENKHCFIENEIMRVEFTFNNFSKIDLTLIDVKINNHNFSNIEHFVKADEVNSNLDNLTVTNVIVKFKCVNGLGDEYIDINDFEFKFKELENLNITAIKPYTKNHSKNKVLIIPEIPILDSSEPSLLCLDNDCINKEEITIKRKNPVDLEIFDMKINVNQYKIHDFFGKKKLNKSEYELYDYMLGEFYKSLTLESNVHKDYLKILLNFNFKDYKVVNVDSFDIVIRYGMINEDVKYSNELVVDVKVEYKDSLIIPNFEILPFNLIPSEQISLENNTNREASLIKGSMDDNIDKQEKWISFLENNNEYKWILLLNLRNVSTFDITCKSTYERYINNEKERYENDDISIKTNTNRKIMIPIEASLFNKIADSQKSIAYNILMNFKRNIKIEYFKNNKHHLVNLMSNLKLEDCYNSQKLVNRQDILITMNDGVNTFKVGEKKRIRLQPKIFNTESDLKMNKNGDNMLISLMVLDIISSEDVLEKENIVLINGMRTFNIDQLNQDKMVSIEMLFTTPGSYEINCLCEIGRDPSSVLKYFGTRALTVRVLE